MSGLGFMDLEVHLGNNLKLNPEEDFLTCENGRLRREGFHNAPGREARAGFPGFILVAAQVSFPRPHSPTFPRIYQLQDFFLHWDSLECVQFSECGFPNVL